MKFIGKQDKRWYQIKQKNNYLQNNLNIMIQIDLVIVNYQSNERISLILSKLSDVEKVFKYFDKYNKSLINYKQLSDDILQKILFNFINFYVINI